MIVHLVGDGTPMGTKVLDEKGEAIQGITSATLHLSAGSPPIVDLRFLPSEILEKVNIKAEALIIDPDLRELLVHFFETHWRSCGDEPAHCNAGLRLRDALVARGVVSDRC